MNTDTKQVLHNLVALVESLEPEQTITREDLINRLRRPVPIDDPPSEAVLHHACRHRILNAGIKIAEIILTYPEAAELAQASVKDIREAVYRKDLIHLTGRRDERDFSGVTLTSLVRWRNWSLEEIEEAVARLTEIRS